MAERFVYALVARGNTPLAEYSRIQGTNNVKPIALRMLENIDPKKQMHVLDQDKYVFHCYTTTDRMNYLCLADKSANSQLRATFLDELQKKWISRYGNKGATFKSLEKSMEFAPEIEALFNTFNSESAAKIATIKGNIAEAQEKMTENLAEALIRGEKLTIMEQKADTIRTNADTFKRSANQVKNKMCFQRYRWYFLGALIVIILILVIVFSICNIDFRNCGNNKSK